MLILGDFNFHVDDPSNTYAKKFLETISLFDLIQHVKIQTHTAGHILDLVMSRDDLLIENIISDSSINSDHFAILFQLSIPCPPRPRSVITYRNWKQVYFPTFDNDVSSRFLQFPPSLNEGVSQYYSRTLEIVDKHAPLKSKTVTVRMESPWYTANLTNEKCLRRRLERKARRAGLPTDLKTCSDQRNRYNHLLSEAKTNYYRSNIVEAPSADMWRFCNKFFGKPSSSVLPNHSSELA